ncbi:DUF429 domain-containing protein [Fimbriiglobus ruber]|uniref:DUF429 domain-containing protein n=1 Tax=Fimbriiglobus ruber TaxID=1908690 RepID=A0A225E157_9BACT|nr:DUF429 domain-containing protein [Fimbriiglobus ruber]OWK45524.1 hypothetical protein FRUB_01855 [Fimbriiglobus ruber]
MADASTPVSPKRKKLLFADVASDFEKALLASVLPDITSGRAGFVAVGIDMAAQEDNWGVSVITIDEGLSRGSLRLLLPHRFDLDGYKKKHPVKPSGAFIAQLVSGLIEHRIPAAVAVDVPFGWPQEHSSFLEAWSAVPVQGVAISPPSRSCFEYRLCDRAMMRLLKQEGRAAAVLAVGADKIASAAFQWAIQRVGLPGFGQVDVGHDPPVGGEVVYFETYPSALVRLNYPSFAGYKTLKETKEGGKAAHDQPAERQARHDLLDAIRGEYCIDTTHCVSALEAACATSASDAFDGFLSAITAWDYLKWRTRQAGTVRMSSPTELLGPRTAAAEKARIEKEGWFLVRLPISTVGLHDDVGEQEPQNDGRARVESTRGEG